MFGRSKIKTVQQDAPLISAERLSLIQDALEPFGLDSKDDYGFAHHINSPASYHGGSLEWTIREASARFIVDACGGTVYALTVINYNRERFSAEQLNTVNARLKDIFNH